MNSAKKNQSTYLTIGIIGAILTMIGDVLLMGVSSYGATDIFDKFNLLASKLSYIRIGLAGAFGTIGIPMCAVGLYVLYLTLPDQKSRLASVYRNTIIGSFGTLGGCVHVICCYLMMGLKMNVEAGDKTPLMTSLRQQAGFAIPVLAVFFILYIINSISMALLIGKGKTILPRWMWILNPLLLRYMINWTGLVFNSAFMNGLCCTNMSLGALIILCAWGIVIAKKDS